MATSSFLSAVPLQVEEVSKPAPTCLPLPLYAIHQTSYLPALLPSKALTPDLLKMNQVI